MIEPVGCLFMQRSPRGKRPSVQRSWLMAFSTRGLCDDLMSRDTALVLLLFPSRCPGRGAQLGGGSERWPTERCPRRAHRALSKAGAQRWRRRALGPAGAGAVPCCPAGTLLLRLP